MNDKPETIVGYVSPLKRICMTIGELPTSYLETMTYYEMLVWFTKFLQEKVIPTINNNAEAVKELQQLFIELQNYVNNYFDNLDVQEEINNKLDEMAETGQLTDIIAQYLGLAGMITFDNVSDMKLADNLVNGSKCQTLGFYNANDKGKAIYKIRNVTNEDVIDEKFIIALYNENLVAELVYNDELNIMQLGYTDDIADTFTAYNKGIKTLLIPNGTYHLKGGEYSTINLKGYKNSNLVIDNVVTFNKLNLENIDITAENISQMFLPTGTNVDVFVKDINVNSEIDYFVYSPSSNMESVTFNNINIINCKFENLGVSPFRLVANGNTLKCYDSTFKNIGTNLSTRTSGLNFGSSTDELIGFENCYIENNYFYNLTSANSTGDDSSECQAIKCRCVNSYITNNKIEKINGTGADHEGIYVKGIKAIISDNIMIDCGQGDGAITTKPVEYLECNNNIILTKGNGILARCIQGNVNNNTIKIDTESTNLFHAIDVGYTNLKEIVIQNNNINIKDSDYVVIFRYEGSIFKNNLINAENITRIFGFNNVITGTQFIENNIINMKNCHLFRMNEQGSNFNTKFINNKFSLDECSNISEFASNKPATKNDFIDNTFTFKNNESTDSIFSMTNANLSTEMNFINNIFESINQIDNIVAFYGGILRFIDNKMIGIPASYLSRNTSNSITLMDIENNSLLVNNLIRFSIANVSITDLKVANNLLFGNTNIFTTNTATVTNAFLINNTFGGGTITNNISATTLKNYGNGSYY